MAKRGRAPRSGLASLIAQLETLDGQRRKLIAGIRAAADSLMSGENPFPWSEAKSGRGTGTTKRKGGRRKGFKMSAESRAKIAAAQKKRWAAARKAKTG